LKETRSYVALQAYAKDEESQKFLEDQIVKEKLASAKVLADVKSADYDAIFYIGGHGPVLDLASDEDNAKLASEVCTLFA
jgi:putative intracellular protease/amidase